MKPFISWDSGGLNLFIVSSVQPISFDLKPYIGNDEMKRDFRRSTFICLFCNSVSQIHPLHFSATICICICICSCHLFICQLDYLDSWIYLESSVHVDGLVVNPDLFNTYFLGCFGALFCSINILWDLKALKIKDTFQLK